MCCRGRMLFSCSVWKIGIEAAGEIDNRGYFDDLLHLLMPELKTKERYEEDRRGGSAP